MKEMRRSLFLLEEGTKIKAAVANGDHYRKIQLRGEEFLQYCDDQRRGVGIDEEERHTSVIRE